jgi:hypothetical protein
MLRMGKPKVYAAVGISAAALPLYTFRKVPREGYRPPQDDIVKEHHRESMTW